MSLPVKEKSYVDRLCRSPFAHPTLAKSIATAEFVSSGVEIGSAWFVGKHPGLIAPAKDFLAKHVFYPMMGGHCQCDDKSAEKIDPALMEKAQKKASVCVKGAIMTTAGFATFVPTQMLMDGKFDLKELPKVVKGKSLGLVVTLAALGATTKLAPHLMQKIEDVTDKYIAAPLCMGFNPSQEEKGKGHCDETKELCKLLILDIPSSIISGLVNYRFTHGHLAH